MSPEGASAGGVRSFHPLTSQLLGERASGTSENISFGCNMLSEH